MKMESLFDFFGTNKKEIFRLNNSMQSERKKMVLNAIIPGRQARKSRAKLQHAAKLTETVNRSGVKGKKEENILVWL